MSPGELDLRLGEQFRTLFELGSLGTLSDRQLLDRFARGDAGSEPAFGILVERHGPMVMGVCRRLLADPHLAEDAFQATFLVLARRSGTVRSGDSVGGWLHRVAHRVALRLRVRIDRRKARERPEVGEVAVNEVDRLQRDELRAVIDEEIDRLGDAQRLPVVLCCLEGLSHEEAAHRLDWPVGTVKSRLARGRRRLQGRLLRRGFAPALAAGGPALLGQDASAAVAPALAEATVRGAAALAARGLVAGVVPATALGLVREELASMIAFKLKLAAVGSLAAGGFALLIGFSLAAGPGPEAPPDVAAAKKESARDPAANKSDAPKVAARLSASGKVVDENGTPIAGATVTLREWALHRKSELGFEGVDDLVDTLAETKTDGAGRFRFADVVAPAFNRRKEEAGESVYPWDVVARAPGHGLNWVQLTPPNQRAPLTLTLGREGTVRGRLVEPGGDPVPGATVRVIGINPLGSSNVNGVRTDIGLNLSWSTYPLRARTDAAGRFTIGGLPREKMVQLIVTEPGHELLMALAATTDTPQPDIVAFGATSSARVTQTRHPVHTADFTLTMRTTDHVLTGRVRLEADGKPARNARVRWKQTTTTADAAGRFQLEGLTAGSQELLVTSTGFDVAPTVFTIEIPEKLKTIERDLELPSGLVLTGRVVDGASGKGVANAEFVFAPVLEQLEAPTVPLGGFYVARLGPLGELRFPSLSRIYGETDSEGRYRLVVPAGKGFLRLTTVPRGFARPHGRPDRSADPKFASAVAGRGGQTVAVADFSLVRSRSVVLRVVDPEGRPVANAQVDVRDRNRRPDEPTTRTDVHGRCEVTGLEPQLATVIDVADLDRRLGGTIDVPDVESAGGKAATSFEVLLQPFGSLSGRVLDDEGKPLAVQVLHLYRSVPLSGQSGSATAFPVATRKQIDRDGSYSFDQLIPGASYYTHVEVDGHVTSNSKIVNIDQGQSVVLNDFGLPSTGLDVSGIVVDARGEPLDKVIVNYNSTAYSMSPLFPPTGARWSVKTDGSGRFQLVDLPRGAGRLEVYRSQPGGNQAIRDIKYVEIVNGQKEMRVELPDPNDRLRGVD